VRPGGRDLERTARALLTAHVREIRWRWFVDVAIRQWLERRHVDLAAEVRDDLGEVPNGHRHDPGERGFGRRLRGTHHVRQPCSTRTLGDRERPRNGPDPPVERELADGRVLREPLGWKLSRGAQYRERDREVEAGTLLAERRRREIDRDAPVVGPLERGGQHPAPHAVLRLLARPVGKADDREAGNSRLEMRLDLDLPRLEPDECMGDRASQHHRTVTGRRSHVVTASVKRGSNRRRQAA